MDGPRDVKSNSESGSREREAPGEPPRKNSMLGLIHSNSCIADLLIRGDKDSSFKVDRRTDQTLGYVKIMFARQVTLFIVIAAFQWILMESGIERSLFSQEVISSSQTDSELLPFFILVAGSGSIASFVRIGGNMNLLGNKMIGWTPGAARKVAESSRPRVSDSFVRKILPADLLTNYDTSA